MCLSSVAMARKQPGWYSSNITLIKVALGRALTENIATSTENFICKIYGMPEVDTWNKARVNWFCVGHTQETLPPTSDAAKFHIMRSYYQASVWNQAHSLYPDLPPVTEMGWMHLDGWLVPLLLSLPPIPKACREITSCGCTKRCLGQRCMYLFTCFLPTSYAMCLWALQNVILMWMDSDGTCGYNLIDELFIFENCTFCKKIRFK